MTAPTNSIGDIAEVPQHNSDRENQAGHAEEGWLHTGGIGRKRDMIVLSGGDNDAPARVEGMLIAEPEVAQAVVLVTASRRSPWWRPSPRPTGC